MSQQPTSTAAGIPAPETAPASAATSMIDIARVPQSAQPLLHAQNIAAPPPPLSAGSAQPTTSSLAMAPAAAAAAAAGPHNALPTAYGMVVWPSLPGMQHAAVGVAPPPGPPIGGPGGVIMGRGITGAMTPGRGGIHMTMGSAGPGGFATVGGAAVAPYPGTPVAGGESGNGEGDAGAKARRKQQRANVKDSPAQQAQSPVTPGNRESMVVLRNACDACHRMKRKCDGLQPCNRCRRRSRPCGYSYKQKSGPPKGSKRKLIAADEDLLENRQGRPKLLPLAMWPKDAEEELSSATAAAANEANSNNGANRMNRLLAVGGMAPQQPPPPPRLPGISIPPEGSASNGAGAAAAAAAVAAASAANNPASAGRVASPALRPGVAMRPTTPISAAANHNPGQSSAGGIGPAAAAVAAAVAVATANAAANANAAAAAAAAAAAKNRALASANGKGKDDRHAVNRMPLPTAAAQLSLEARAGAYKRAQEAAAAGMAAARAYVEGVLPTEEKSDASGGKDAVTPTTTTEQPFHQQEILGRIVATSSPTAAASPLSTTQASVAGLAPITPVSLTSLHDSPAPLITMHAPAPATAATSQPSSSPALTAGASPAAVAAHSGVPRSGGASSPNGGHAAHQPQQSTQHAPHPGMSPGIAPQGIPPGMPMGMPMAYHPQYGMYQPYPQSLYAAYLAQYQLQQGLNPYEGMSMYDGMSPYSNPAAYGHAVSAGGAGAPGTGHGMAGYAHPFSVNAAAAAALAAAQNAAMYASMHRQPKESEEAKQVAVETLLGLKNSQSKGGSPMDEASAQAVAAATAAAVSAAAAAAEEAAAHATKAGADNGTAVSAAAAAAATAKAVAEAVAAAGGLPPPQAAHPAATVASAVREATAPVAHTGQLLAVNGVATAPQTMPAGPAAAAQAQAEAKNVSENSAEYKVVHSATPLAAAAGPSGNMGAQPCPAQNWAPLHGGPEEANAGGRTEAVVTTERVGSVGSAGTAENKAERASAPPPTSETGANGVARAATPADITDGKEYSGLPTEPHAADDVPEPGVNTANRQVSRTIVSSV